jgi:MFS family permease
LFIPKLSEGMRRILPVIVFSQFCCTSLWFAGNGVMTDLAKAFGLDSSALGHLTSAVQFGFITGTLVFAVLSISDRFSPSRVFFGCALLGALLNLGAILESNSLYSLLAFRYLTGFFLAGIYPVGMKIAADYYEKGLGTSLGFLVGALVVGTASPHLAKVVAGDLPWRFVVISTSASTVIGGVMMLLLVPDGPYRKPALRLDLSSSFKSFRNPDFRSPALGYFGHMWELYTFWAFVPFMLSAYMDLHPDTHYNIPMVSFLIIGLGGLACVAAGYLSLNFGAKKVATAALTLSCACCLLSPLAFRVDSGTVWIGFLGLWGLFVIADSPLFSTLVAQNAPAEGKGSALTIVNCIGFAITIVSIQSVNFLKDFMSPEYLFVMLAAGPVLGLWALRTRQQTGLA